MHMMMRTAESTVRKAILAPFRMPKKNRKLNKIHVARKWQAVRSQNWLQDLALNSSDPEYVFNACNVADYVKPFVWWWNFFAVFIRFFGSKTGDGDRKKKSEMKSGREQVEGRGGGGSVTAFDFICLPRQLLQSIRVTIGCLAVSKLITKPNDDQNKWIPLPPCSFFWRGEREILLGTLLYFYSSGVDSFDWSSTQSEAEFQLMNNIFFFCEDIFHFSLLCVCVCTANTVRSHCILYMCVYCVYISCVSQLKKRRYLHDADAVMNHDRIFQSPGCVTVDKNLYDGEELCEISSDESRASSTSFISRRTFSAQCNFCWWIPFMCAYCVQCARRMW